MLVLVLVPIVSTTLYIGKGNSEKSQVKLNASLHPIGVKLKTVITPDVCCEGPIKHSESKSAMKSSQ